MPCVTVRLRKNSAATSKTPSTANITCDQPHICAHLYTIALLHRHSTIALNVLHKWLLDKQSDPPTRYRRGLPLPYQNILICSVVKWPKYMYTYGPDTHVKTKETALNSRLSPMQSSSN